MSEDKAIEERLELRNKIVSLMEGYSEDLKEDCFLCDKHPVKGIYEPHYTDIADEILQLIEDEQS